MLYPHIRIKPNHEVGLPPIVDRLLGLYRWWDETPRLDQEVLPYFVGKIAANHGLDLQKKKNQKIVAAVRLLSHPVTGERAETVLNTMMHAIAEKHELERWSLAKPSKALKKKHLIDEGVQTMWFDDPELVITDPQGVCEQVEQCEQNAADDAEALWKLAKFLTGGEAAEIGAFS